MWAKRASQLRDLHLAVDLEPARCLDAADYLARYAPRFGIRADLELRRNRSGWAYDRHFVLCHGQGRGWGGRRASSASTKPIWIMHLILGPDAERETNVTLGMHTYRRLGRGVEAGRVAEAYRDLLSEALRVAAAPRDRRAGNVIALRPYADLPPIASA